MAFAFPSDLSPELYPLAWLLGSWRGEGTVGYHQIEQSAIRQSVVFTHDGGPYLACTATTWLVGSDGSTGQVWHTESGFWRVVPGQLGSDGAAKADPPFELEVLVADPAGFVSVYVGEVDGPRVSLGTDLLARTASAVDMTAAKRLYGLVESDLLWAWDIAAFGQPMGSYLAARLVRQDDGPGPVGDSPDDQVAGVKEGLA